MLLALDIGNTQIALGVFDKKKLLFNARLCSDPSRTFDEFAVTILQLLQVNKLEKKYLDSVVISCVAPPLLHTFEKLSEVYFGTLPVVVEPGTKTGIKIEMDNPAEVGGDRIANAVGAKELYGCPVIVVDFGTATTFDVITAKEEYVGGAIAPGLEVSLKALVENASMLPKIEIKKPEKAIGGGTISALQSGFFYGYLGMVENLVNKLTAEMENQPFVVATGGLASLVAGESQVIDKIDPFLTLHGLRVIFESGKPGFSKAF